SVTKGQQPGVHPALIALLALAFQVYLALGSDNGLDVIGLPQGLDAHIIVHTEQDVLEISPGKAVFGDFAYAAVLHIGAEQLGQHHADLAFAFAAPALDDHHPLALVAGNEAITDKFLNHGNI